VKKAPVRKVERFLSEFEIAQLAAALDAETQHSGNPYPPAAIKLLLLTGCRKGEITNLRWDHVDFRARMSASPRQQDRREGRVYQRTGARLAPGSPAHGGQLAGDPWHEGR
jgi:integrase